MRSILVYLFIFGVPLLPQGSLFAIPQNIATLCLYYQDTPKCQAQSLSCQSCHQVPPHVNPFGQDLLSNLKAMEGFDHSAEAFQTYLPEALKVIGALDSDGDGFSNDDEFYSGSEPGNRSDTPVREPIDRRVYDVELSLRRIKLGFCGESPSYEERESLKKHENPRVFLHQILDVCLGQEFWTQTALQRLADPKIRPNLSIGSEGNPFVIGDYRYDYRLFTYILTGDRDARDLLLADYHIDEAGQKTTASIPDQDIPDRIVVGNGQPLVRERRAGMITTQWFLSSNTMFATLPRNTAAQAYRSYLGLDIAKSEGLFPVVGEPRDVDQKGVKQPACAFCHSTLDPLAYSFANYHGLNGSRRKPYQEVGAYDPDLSPWEADGFLFHQPVRDLLEWAEQAAQSDAFKKNLTLMFYRYAVGHDPETYWEKVDFEKLWQSLPEDSYQAEKLLHRIVDTLSFAGVRP